MIQDVTVETEKLLKYEFDKRLVPISEEDLRELTSRIYDVFSVAPLKARNHVLKIGSRIELDLRSGELRTEGKVLSFTPTHLKVIALLALEPGVVRSHEEFYQAIWPEKLRHSFLKRSEAGKMTKNLRVTMNTLRNQLAAQQISSVSIKTFTGKGYALVLN
ncbi:MAG: response regulator transcription factor [Pedobacter sp.]|nr:MAG: response regulator transcription factor [Pedobacter sp.]